MTSVHDNSAYQTYTFKNINKTLSHLEIE